MDKVVHFEIPFDDKKRAMAFYEAARKEGGADRGLIARNSCVCYSVQAR